MAIKKQWVVRPLPRKTVQPTFAIVEVPKGYTLDDISVLDEELKEFRVLLCLTFREFRRKAIRVWIDLRHLLTLRHVVHPPATAWDHVDVEL